MEYLKYFCYGLIQGLTEFVPVSSTAHLKVISHFIGIDDPGRSVSAIIQLGSVFALFWYFRDDIFKLRNYSSRNGFDYFLNERLVRSVLIGTIPIIFFGASIKIFASHFFDNIIRSNISIASFSFLMAFFMYMADNSKKSFKNLKNHYLSDSFLIGISQALAIFPGVSRSGVTISAALITGWERGDAAKFSFLLGLPAITFAAIAELASSFYEISTFSFYPLILGLCTTFISSLLAIDLLLKYFAKNGLRLFILYRFVFGVVILLNL